MADVGYRRVGSLVELRGRVGGGTAARMFTLPEGFRPSDEQRFQVETERGSGTVIIQPDGGVLGDPTDGWILLDGIMFPAAE